VSDKPHLTLLDLSDRELLLVLRDVADAATGYALAADIADRLDIGEDGRRSVSVRLSWLTRYGAVEREYRRDSQGRLELTPGGNPVKLQGWKLTDVGFQMATGTLKKGTQKTLDSLDDGAMLMTMRWLSQRVVGSNATVSKLMDREYRHGVGRR
jgi:DNA-binding transcriptional ArsR family regulator